METPRRCGRWLAKSIVENFGEYGLVKVEMLVHVHGLERTELRMMGSAKG
jgi:hypothetical protein